MIDQFVDFCLRRRIAVIVIALLLSLFGIYAWETLKRRGLPGARRRRRAGHHADAGPGRGGGRAAHHRAARARDQRHARPAADALESTFGLSLITVLFRDGYEDYWVRQRLLERINQVTLPAGAAPSLDPVAGPGGEIYRYTLESDSRTCWNCPRSSTGR